MSKISWRGPTDMTLHRLSRSKLVEQLRWVKENSERYDKSVIVSTLRSGEKQSIVAVREQSEGIFLYTFNTETPERRSIIDMAPLLGSDLKVLDVDEVLDKLEACKSEDVWLQFPSENMHTVVGKVLAVSHDDTLTVGLTPVPKDIEEVNEKVRKMCAKAGCKKAREGLLCGACEKLGDCKILKRADEKITKEREEDDADR